MIPGRTLWRCIHALVDFGLLRRFIEYIRVLRACPPLFALSRLRSLILRWVLPKPEEIFPAGEEVIQRHQLCRPASQGDAREL